MRARSRRCLHPAISPRARPAVAAAATNYGGLWWLSTESGWGVNFSHQGNLIYATWYTYDTSGKAWWLSMLATQQGTSQTFTGNILASQGTGLNTASGASPTQIGTGSVTFSDGSNGSFTYTLNGFGTQSKAISKFKYGAVPTCTYSASPNFTSASNYQDLWWVPSEAGWGMNVTQQGSTIYVTWYSYDIDGSPLWLSVLAAAGSRRHVLRHAQPHVGNVVEQFRPERGDAEGGRHGKLQLPRRQSHEHDGDRPGERHGEPDDAQQAADAFPVRRTGRHALQLGRAHAGAASPARVPSGPIAM